MFQSLRRVPLALLVGCTLSAQAQFGAQYQYFLADPLTLEIADLDGDGARDMLASGRDVVRILRQTGAPGLFGSVQMPGIMESLVWAVDLDNDLLPELIGAQPEVPGLRIYRNNGALTFGPAEVLHPQLQVLELKAGDLDHDGDLDLVVLTASGHLVVLYNADAAGQFSPPSFLGQVVGAESLDLVDVDGDNSLDAVFFSRTTNSTYACLNYQGTIDSPMQLTNAGTGMVRDLNNDGVADVLLVNTGEGTVLWQRSDDGGLGQAIVLDASFLGASRAKASDVDGDGDMDVVASSSFTQEVVWFENIDGQGTFGPRQTVAYQMPGVTALLTVDVDNDGDEDVFVASADLDKVFWFANLSNATGAVMGRVFNDINGDGIFNGNDHGLANVRVLCSDLGSTYTNASGMYWFNVMHTHYALALPPQAGWQNTTPSYYEVQVPENGASQFNDFGLRAGDPVSDLEPVLVSGPTRCNENVIYWATVSNKGNTVSDVHLMLSLDEYLQFQGAVPSPTEVIGDAVIWVFPNVQPTHQRSVRLMVGMPDHELMGDTLVDHLDAVAMSGGQVLSTDGYTHAFELECSYDPNDKLADPVGWGEEHLTARGTTFLYTVRFQNTGNAMAHDVKLVDTLDTSLDPATLQVVGYSHTPHVSVDDGGVVRFIFNNIMLPDSGSDMLASNGYVAYKIRHHASVPDGTRILNSAAIYFDMNPAVITNTTWNTLGMPSTSVEEQFVRAGDDAITVFPNPAQGSTTVKFGPAFQGRVRVDLIDATGRLIRTHERRSDTMVISSNGLPPGLYFLRAFSEDPQGPVRTARVIFER